MTKRHATKIGVHGGALLALVASIGACDEEATPSDGGNGTPDGSTGGHHDAGHHVDAGTTPLTFSPCEDADRVGRFSVELADRFTGVSGAVSDGVVPLDVPEVVSSEGECRLLTSKNLFCEDPCAAGTETCGDEGTCVPYPRKQDVGTVHVTGLLEAVTMEPLPPGNSYSNKGTLPHPGFTPGAAMTLHAEGGMFDEIALSGVGVDPLTSEAESVAVESGAAAEVRWNAPSVESPARVHLTLNIAQHGGNPAWIECDVDDTGSFDIPASMVTALYGMGISGFPSVYLTRRSVDSVDHDLGCVEFEVTSSLNLPVEIPGVVSCSGDGDCPDGQTCGHELICQ